MKRLNKILIAVMSVAIVAGMMMVVKVDAKASAPVPTINDSVYRYVNGTYVEYYVESVDERVINPNDYWVDRPNWDKKLYVKQYLLVPKDSSYITQFPNVTAQYDSAEGKWVVTNELMNITEYFETKTADEIDSGNYAIRWENIDPSNISFPNAQGQSMNVFMTDVNPKITVKLYPDVVTDRSVIMTSNNTDVLEVDNEGNLTLKSEGTAVVNVKSAAKPSVNNDITIEVTAGDDNLENYGNTGNMSSEMGDIPKDIINNILSTPGITTKAAMMIGAYGRDYKFLLNAGSLEEPTSETAKSMFQTVYNTKEYKAIQYFDVSLNLKVAEVSDVVKLTQTDKPVKVTVKVPEAMRGYNYISVLQCHENVVTELPAEYDEATNNATFYTSSFSDYALVAKNVEKKADDAKVNDKEEHSDSHKKKSSDSNENKQDEVPAIHKFMEEKYAQIAAAVPGKNTVIDLGRNCNLSNEFIKKLAAKKNCSFTIKLIYNNVNYEIYVPAGAKIDTSFEWYGPKKLMQMFGFKVIK